MRVGLSELYLHLGWFFRTNKDVGTAGKHLGHHVNGHHTDDDVDSSPLGRIRPFLNTKQELALQGLLIHLTGLLKAAANEPRLKVFPVPPKVMVGSISRERVSFVTFDSAGYH